MVPRDVSVQIFPGPLDPIVVGTVWRQEVELKFLTDGGCHPA